MYYAYFFRHLGIKSANAGKKDLNYYNELINDAPQAVKSPWWAVFLPPTSTPLALTMGNTPLHFGHCTRQPSAATCLPCTSMLVKAVMTMPPWSVLSPRRIAGLLVLFSMKDLCEHLTLQT